MDKVLSAIGNGLRSPSGIILFAANLLPLAGILFWGWDAFILLVLYWLETAVIGFWMMMRILSLPTGTLGDFTTNGKKAPATRIGLALFLIVHAGMFMGVHFVFLWSLFSGDWSKRVHGPIDFVRELVIGTGLWLPLLVLFFARGAAFLYETVGAPMIARLNRRTTPPADPDAAGHIIGSFYVRIVVMHCAIIFGGFLSFLGSIGPLIVMVALKTAVDLVLSTPVLNFTDGDKLATAILKPKRGARSGQNPPAS